MPTLRMKEIRGLSPDQRDKRLSELNIELLKLKAMVKAGGSVENPARIREIRRTIARIKTVDNEKAAKEGISNANNPKNRLKT